MKRVYLIFFLICGLQLSKAEPGLQRQAETFITDYTRQYQKLYYAASLASWQANTDIKPENTAKEIEANKKLAEFKGKPEFMKKAQSLLKHEQTLDALTVKQLKAILYQAAHAPGTIPDVVGKLVEAEANQNEALYSFEFKLSDGTKLSANDIDEKLVTETDLARRLEVWQASKEVGEELRQGLANLQTLRNRVAIEMGYSSFFDLETADYGMKASEMVELMDEVYEEIKPLYAQLYTWVKYKLAERYGGPVPQKMPAHWLPNRWSQSWPGIVESVNLDDLYTYRSPKWIVKQAELFYVSMGFPVLPRIFLQKSDLYPAPADGSRKKNSHASAWHLDLDKDVRSLMSVTNNDQWFATTHHELGHIYYYISYTNPDVPVLLREGANRGFHEGIGELISIASHQEPYMREIGLLPDSIQIDKIQWLLNEALDNIVFMPWAAGVMTHFEYELYEKQMPQDEFNRRWWELVEHYQGIVPPAERGEELCDAATKTHINNDPAQYYDYAVAKLLQYQIHDYICRNILKTDPHNANYFNSTDVGEYLKSILSVGQTRDWRELLREKTGEDLSARAMLDYFQPLMDFLQKENEGRDIGF